MSLEILLKDRIIEKTYPSRKQAFGSFELARRDLNAAKSIFEDKSYDWTLAIAYNAMLQSGRSLMFLKGYRPYGKYKHVAVVKFVHEVFGKEVTDKTVSYTHLRAHET